MDKNLITQELAYLRRYSRALTGSQARGDGFVRHVLEALVEEPRLLDKSTGVHVSIFTLFHKILNGVELVGVGRLDTDAQNLAVQSRLEMTTSLSRKILLLTVLENFSLSDAAKILDISEKQAEIELSNALSDIEQQSRADVLIIEDEPLIALELESHVISLGHSVVGTATTHGEAIKMYHEHKPGLILADIQLADGSSGAEAVKEILSVDSIPVIFITAFPERLLTGERPEPTYLITKPFTTQVVKVAISQAIFLRSTDGGMLKT